MKPISILTVLILTMGGMSGGLNQPAKAVSSSIGFSQFLADSQNSFQDYNYLVFWQGLTPASQKLIAAYLHAQADWNGLNLEDILLLLGQDTHHLHYRGWASLAEAFQWPQKINSKHFKQVKLSHDWFLEWIQLPPELSELKDSASQLSNQRSFTLTVPSLRALLDFSEIPKPYWSEVSFQKLNSLELQSAPIQKYLKMLEEELGKYPIGLFQLAGIKRIVLVKNLYYGKQERAALPDFVNEVLYFDVLKGKSSEIYQRHVIHHEFYHLLEEQAFQSPYYKDPHWAALNPAGFRYGAGGAYARTSDQFELVHPQPGFINRYSMSGLEEDKADVFAALMRPEEARLLEKWSQTDPALRAKIRYLKAFFVNKVPEMNELFWKAIAP